VIVANPSTADDLPALNPLALAAPASRVASIRLPDRPSIRFQLTHEWHAL
jgi:hypothetical protein